MTKDKLVPLNSRITEKLHLDFKMVAIKNQKSMQQILEELIKKYVDENKKK
jgi:hypothetical protein